MPKEIEKFFPDLEAIKIIMSNLKSIKKADLKPFSKLKELCLGKNDLETLDSDLFEFNRELRFVSFYQNKLKFIGEDILKPLKKLEDARFMYNCCISQEALKSSDIPELVDSLTKQCSSTRMIVIEQTELNCPKTSSP